jgi:hypothetical protein
MLFREIIAVYSVNDKEPMNTLCGKNAVGFLRLKQKASGSYNNHCALKGYLIGP